MPLSEHLTVLFHEAIAACGDATPAMTVTGDHVQLRIRCDAQRRVYLPAPRVAEAFGVSQSAGGPLTAFVDVAYRGGQQSTWRLLTDQEREAALRTAHLPDGLVDDPHEHARLTRNHTRGHHRRLRQYAGSTAAAVLESGPDTARVLGSGLAELLAHAAR